jgi:hypothetical protein
MGKQQNFTEQRKICTSFIAKKSAIFFADFLLSIFGRQISSFPSFRERSTPVHDQIF